MLSQIYQLFQRIANGMPISALVGKKNIMKKFSEIFYSLTFAGETLSLHGKRSFKNS